MLAQMIKRQTFRRNLIDNIFEHFYHETGICAFLSSSSVQIRKLIEPIIAEIMKFLTLTIFIVFIAITYGGKLDQDIIEKRIGKHFEFSRVLFLLFK